MTRERVSGQLYGDTVSVLSLVQSLHFDEVKESGRQRPDETGKSSSCWSQKGNKNPGQALPKRVDEGPEAWLCRFRTIGRLPGSL